MLNDIIRSWIVSKSSALLCFIGGSGYLTFAERKLSARARRIGPNRVGWWVFAAYRRSPQAPHERNHPTHAPNAIY